MKVIHISFGDSAYENLKNVFHKSNKHQNEQIICINEDFSVGPIYKLDSNKGVQERKQWLKEVLTKTGLTIDKDFLDWIETILKRNSQIALEVPANSKVILWHGNNTSDKIGMRFIAFLLQNKNIQFKEVNVTEYSHYIEYKVCDLQDKEIPYAIKSLGGMPQETILDAFQMKKTCLIQQLTV